MDYILEPSKKIPLVSINDVVVVGGGLSGIVAALSSARFGVKTMLIEKQGFLGGNALLPLPVIGMLDKNGKQIIKGIPEELFSELRRRKGADIHRKCPFSLSLSVIDPVSLQMCSLEMLEKSNVEILLHSFVRGSILQKTIIKYLIIESKSGSQAIASKIFIDCTGDGDIAYYSGVPYEMGSPDSGEIQPPSVIFKVRGVDKKRLVEFLIQNPEIYQEFKFTPEHFRKNDRFTFIGLRSYLALKNESMRQKIPVDRVVFFTTLFDDEIGINMTRILNVNGVNSYDLTRAEIEGRKQIPYIVDFFRSSVPGFENVFVSGIGHSVGVRETRRIIGEYILSKKDIMQGEKFKDVIGCASYFIELHNKENEGYTYEFPDNIYQLPYRMLLPKKVKNLLLAGRCSSATHEAMGAIRIMSTCMALGQAAGTAAALSVLDSVPPNLIDVKHLQEVLKQQNAFLGY
jgi:hypothetical protein